ncbi:MAG: hypothetical protein VB143_08215 [Burkholderia sp.]
MNKGTTSSSRLICATTPIFNSVSRHRFYPKFVSRKIGGGSAA